MFGTVSHLMIKNDDDDDDDDFKTHVLLLLLLLLLFLLYLNGVDAFPINAPHYAYSKNYKYGS